MKNNKMKPELKDPSKIEVSRLEKLKRGLWVTAGTIFLALGILGIPLPILPTTPFLLLAAACYLRGSEKLHKWLLNHRLFGEYIRNFEEGKGIPLRAKIIAISFIWITMGIAVIFFVPYLFAKIAMIAIATAVTIYLIRFKTLKQ